MTDEIRIVLVGAPKGKGRPRFNRKSGRAYTPEATVRYESVLRLAAQDAMGARPPLAGPLELEILAVMPIPASWPKKKRADALAGRVQPTGKPDFDNILKMCDGLNAVVWQDDAQVTTLARPRKRYGAVPRLEITVRPAPLDPAPDYADEAEFF